MCPKTPYARGSTPVTLGCRETFPNTQRRGERERVAFGLWSRISQQDT